MVNVTMLNVIMQSVIMLSVIMLNVTMLNVIMVNVTMLNVIMQSGVMLSVIMANVLAPTNANAVSYQAKKEVTSQSAFQKLAAFLKQFLFLNAATIKLNLD
jgi:hypothetical protein